MKIYTIEVKDDSFEKVQTFLKTTFNLNLDWERIHPRVYRSKTSFNRRDVAEALYYKLRDSGHKVYRNWL